MVRKKKLPNRTVIIKIYSATGVNFIQNFRRGFKIKHVLIKTKNLIFKILRWTIEIFKVYESNIRAQLKNIDPMLNFSRRPCMC